MESTISPKKSRLIGLDFARGLAVFGMVVVNYKLVVGGQDYDLVSLPAILMSGRASALFVVLAGMGIAMMTGVAGSLDAGPKPDKVRLVIRRAFFLLVVGFLYTPVWPADILHFYGIYMLLGAWMLSRSTKTLWAGILGLVGLQLVLLLFLDYERGWNFETLEYVDFWTPAGLVRHLFFNGFHPVVPWAAFLLTGIWLARQDLFDKQKRHEIISLSVAILLSSQIFNTALEAAVDLWWPDAGVDPVLFELGPMPPLPFYMFSAGSLAVIIILLAIEYCDGDKSFKSRIIDWISDAGRLALTLYVAHVVIGMGTLEALGMLGTGSNGQALLAAMVFCMLGTVFSVFWRKRFKLGPLAWAMRKITDPS